MRFKILKEGLTEEQRSLIFLAVENLKEAGNFMAVEWDDHYIILHPRNSTIELLNWNLLNDLFLVVLSYLRKKIIMLTGGKFHERRNKS